MSDTIFYTLKLKRSRAPQELFEKLQKSVKPRGATKKWTCTVGENGEYFRIDFNDGESEAFEISFNEKNICEGFCKVFFPLDGELFEDEKKSEFKALLNMIYSARAFFSEMKLTDDYGLAESYTDSKKYKIVFRELTGAEINRAKQIFEAGHTEYREFIMALLFELRGLPYSKEYWRFINGNVRSRYGIDEANIQLYVIECLDAFIESFLYETSEYREGGLLRENQDYILNDLNSVMFSVGAFYIGIGLLLYFEEGKHGIDQKSSQVLKLLYHTAMPLIKNETDEFKKCVLAYRYFVSIYEWLGFKYIGKTEE